MAGWSAIRTTSHGRAPLWTPLRRGFRPDSEKGEPLTQEHMDLAASVQRHCEEVIFHLLRRLHEETGLDRVCIAGGVAQNSVANGKMTRNTPFKEVYIPSAGHDAGISMGSAQYHIHCGLSQPRVPSLKYAHTGCRFSNEEVEAFLKSEGVEYIRYESDAELYDVVSDALVDGKVIGWFNGRAEFGPRALGGRASSSTPAGLTPRTCSTQDQAPREFPSLCALHSERARQGMV